MVEGELSGDSGRPPLPPLPPFPRSSVGDAPATSQGRQGCLELPSRSWEEQQGAWNHSLKACSLTGGLVQTPYFTGKLRGGKGPSHHLPAGDSDPGSTLSLSPTDQGL